MVKQPTCVVTLFGKMTGTIQLCILTLTETITLTSPNKNSKISSEVLKVLLLQKNMKNTVLTLLMEHQKQCTNTNLRNAWLNSAMLLLKSKNLMLNTMTTRATIEFYHSFVFKQLYNYIPLRLANNIS